MRKLVLFFVKSLALLCLGAYAAVSYMAADNAVRVSGAAVESADRDRPD